MQSSTISSIFLLFFLSLSAISYCQQNRDTIGVNMGKSQPNYSFFPIESMLTHLSSEKIILKNTPGNIINFKIKERIFDSISPTLKIFYGIDSLKNYIIILDSDFDGDLKNEMVYTLPESVKTNKDSAKKIIDGLNPVEIKLSNGRTLALKPSIFNLDLKYTMPEDSVWHLSLDKFQYRKGAFNFNGRDYVILSNGLTDPPLFYFEDRNIPYSIHQQPDLPYELNEPAYLNKNRFIVSHISPEFDSITIICSGPFDSAFGSRAGLYALNMQGMTLDNKLFDLTSLRGNFVMIDFWGSWCAPCLEQIPEMVKINEKYRDKLKIVSVAYDEKRNIGKLKKIIQSRKMNWINLFTDSELADNISIQYHVKNYPTTILIAPNGKIVYRGYGLKDLGKLKEKIKSLLPD